MPDDITTETFGPLPSTRLAEFDKATKDITERRGAVYAHPSVDFRRASAMKAVIAEIQRPIDIDGHFAHIGASVGIALGISGRLEVNRSQGVCIDSTLEHAQVRNGIAKSYGKAECVCNVGLARDPKRQNSGCGRSGLSA